MLSNQDRFSKALSAFEAAHREDPKQVVFEGAEIPWSLHYHRRLRHWVEQLATAPPEPLLLAAHCQHIRRWTLPRENFSMDRNGYRQWRKRLADFHAQEAGRILEKAGYAAETVERVQQFLRKFRLKRDPEVQLFEDAICLVFLENELTTFSQKHDQAKLVSILRKTWQKMSPAGHQTALQLVEALPAATGQLVRQAVLDD